jgi:hypothetical protein
MIIFLKSLSIIVGIYLLLVVITTLLSNHTYSYRTYQPFNNGIISPLLQPIMYVFGYQKVTHWYDWEDFDKKQLIDTKGLEFSTDTNTRDFNTTFSLTNALASLGSVQKAAIIEPDGYTGKWSIIYFIDGQCKVNTLEYTGKVKIILDGKGQLFALGDDNKIYNLKLTEIINRKEHLEILHI